MEVVHPGLRCEAGVAKPSDLDRSTRVNIHRNARLRPQARALLVSLILDEGWRVADAAAAAGLSERRAHVWLGRFRAGGEPALNERSSAPARSPHAVPATMIAERSSG
jgi:hypothetical protein